MSFWLYNYTPDFRIFHNRTLSHQMIGSKTELLFT